jgi:hypothetical protein
MRTTSSLLLWYLDSTVGTKSTAEWRGHDKPELSLSGNAGDSLADYDADFLPMSYHMADVEYSGRLSLCYPDVPTFFVSSKFVARYRTIAVLAKRTASSKRSNS